MIILDTNVISEIMKSSVDSAVLNWLDAQTAETLYLTSITVAELLFGIGNLPAGRRKDALAGALKGVLDLFEDRVLPFDTRAAHHYAQLAVHARIAGKGLAVSDGFIAAIASAYGFSIATRDTVPFKAVNLKVINPWTYRP